MKSSEDAARATHGLRDLDVLLGQERRVLEEVGLPRETVDGVMQAAEACAGFLDWPDDVSAHELRESVGDARRAACTEASFRQVPHPTKRTSKAAGVAGGAVVIVANAKISIPPLTEFSIYLGGKMIDAGARGLFAWDQHGRLRRADED